MPCGDPPSPETIKNNHLNKDLFVLLEARHPRKGKTILFPHQTVADLIGPQKAAKFCAASQKIEVSRHTVGAPNEIYMLISDILDEVRKMVISLPMREVTQSLLDEEVRKLATIAFLDPDQNSLQIHYIRAATGLLRQILKDNEKVIIEATQTKAALVVQDTCHNDDEDEDHEAEWFPLA